jgi:hypothetical protein
VAGNALKGSGNALPTAGSEAYAHSVLRFRAGLRSALLLCFFEGLSARVSAVPAGSAAAATFLDEVVAVVQNHAILQSELDLDARLTRARREGAGALALPPSREGLADSLRRLIDAQLVLTEADRLHVFEVTQADVDRAVAELRTAIGPKAYDQFLNEHQVGDTTIQEVVRRDLRVHRYLDGRFRLAARPRDADIDTYFQKHEEEFRGKRKEDVLDIIRERVGRARFDRLIASFVADLRKRATLRVLHDPLADRDGAVMSGTATAAEATASQEQVP